LRSGLHAKSLVIRGEDAAELEQLIADYHDQFQPSNPLERFLMDSIVNAEWQLRRLRKVEASLWERELSGDGDALGVLDSPVFSRLQRRIDAAERSYYRALKELHRVRKEAAAAQPATDDPEIGFVALSSDPDPKNDPKPLAAAPPAARAPMENLALRL